MAGRAVNLAESLQDNHLQILLASQVANPHDSHLTSLRPDLLDSPLVNPPDNRRDNPAVVLLRSPRDSLVPGLLDSLRDNPVVSLPGNQFHGRQLSLFRIRRQSHRSSLPLTLRPSPQDSHQVNPPCSHSRIPHLCLRCSRKVILLVCLLDSQHSNQASNHFRILLVCPRISLLPIPLSNPPRIPLRNHLRSPTVIPHLSPQGSPLACPRCNLLHPLQHL